MYHINKITGLILLIGITSCASTQYISDSLGPVDSKQFTSYTLEDNCSVEINPIIQIRIKNAIQQFLTEKQLEHNAKADLLIKYFVKNKDISYTQECSQDYFRWEGGQTCKKRVIAYEEGTIVIDLIDTRNNTIIWHGAAYGPSWNRLRNPNEKVKETVSKLLQRFFK